MGVEVVVAPSVRFVIDDVATRLAAPLPDPFTPDIVVVPTPGVRDWLVESLALRGAGSQGGEGIVANVEFLFPNQFNLWATGLGREHDSVWAPVNLQWEVLRLLSEDPGAVPGFDPERGVLAHARRVAELFDRYGAQRPEMLEAWRRGEDTDGSAALPAAFRWQPALWRRVAERLGVTPAERFVEAQRAVAAPDWVSPSPGRITVVGLELYSPAKVGLLTEIGRRVDVAVFAVAACPSAGRSLSLGTTPAQRRRHLDVLGVVRHPLLRSWGGAGIEAQALLAAGVSDLTNRLAPAGDASASVLAAIQSSLANDAPPPRVTGRDVVLDGGDGSVQVHLCHGATRQVEVARDAILHRLADDPSLRPRDVLVVCPDLDRYASLIEPVLGARLGEVQLPVAVIDPTGATATPVAAAIDLLLTVASGRVGASEVGDLLALDAVRRRFGITDDDLVRVGRWVESVGTSWGIDARHRAQSPWNYPDTFEDGTWQLTVDRLAAGMLIASPEIRAAVGGIAPHDDLGGSDLDTVGRLAEFVGRLRHLVDVVDDAHTPDEWARVLDVVLDEFVAVPPDDTYQLDDARDAVDHLHRAASTLADTAASTPLRLGVAEVRDLVVGRLRPLGSRGRPWIDAVRVASPTRLRGVPARVVVVLGFSSDAFRSSSIDGDDVLALDPLIGERDRHAEARLGLLAVVTAPTDALIITTDGHDITNNKPVPLPVPLEELLDAVAGVISERPAPAEDERRPVVVRHPRQAADPVNFGLSDDAGRNVTEAAGGPWSFDPTGAEVAKRVAAAARSGSGEELAPGMEWPVLPAPTLAEAAPRGWVDIADLSLAIRRPAEVYLRRLQVALPTKIEAGTGVERVPLWPGGLDQWKLADGLLTELVGAPHDRNVAREAWKRRLRLVGGLPPGKLGDRYSNELFGDVVSLVDRVPELAGERRSIEIDFIHRLDGSDAIGGTVFDGSAVDVRIRGTATVIDTNLVSVTFSEQHDGQLVHPWVGLAALTMVAPETDWQAVAVSRTGSKKVAGVQPVAVHRLKMGGATSQPKVAAAEVLHFALCVWARAHCGVVPLLERTSWLTDEASESALDSALSDDLGRSSHTAYIFGELDVSSLRRGGRLDGVDDGLPDVLDDRFGAWAKKLRDIFGRTTVKSEERIPPKRTRGGAS